MGKSAVSFVVINYELIHHSRNFAIKHTTASEIAERLRVTQEDRAILSGTVLRLRSFYALYMYTYIINMYRIRRAHVAPFRAARSSHFPPIFANERNTERNLLTRHVLNRTNSSAPRSSTW